MGRDFYNILGVNRNASDEEIKKAYKKGARKWHPDKNPENKEEATKKFKEISEAFEILSNPEKKKLYDQFGEEGINPQSGGGGFSGGNGANFNFTDPQDLFSRIFGGKGGFNFGMPRNGGNSSFHFGGGDDDDEMGSFGGIPGFSFGGMNGGQKRPKKPKTVTHELNFTLEELYQGLTKKVKITRNVINDDGKTMRTESDIKSFDVKPGWKSGTKITFENCGDKPSRDAPAGDIVFVIQEKPHHNFKREGDNLIHSANITLKEALCGGSYQIKHLDGNIVKVPLNPVISPGSSTTIPGRGMPISRNPTQKGNLIVKFNVVFPNKLTETQKNELQRIL